MGIVNKVFAPDDLMEATLAYANDLAVNASPASMTAIKMQMYTHPKLSIDDALTDANRLMNESFRRPDFKEGVASFVEKRSPAFPPTVG